MDVTPSKIELALLDRIIKGLTNRMNHMKKQIVLSENEQSYLCAYLEIVNYLERLKKKIQENTTGEQK